MFGKELGLTTTLDQLTTKQITWDMLPERREEKEEPYKEFLYQLLENKTGFAIPWEKKVYLLSTSITREIFPLLENEIPHIYERTLSLTLAHELGHTLNLEHNDKKYVNGDRNIMYPKTLDLFDLTDPKEIEYTFTKEDKETISSQQCKGE